MKLLHLISLVLLMIIAAMAFMILPQPQLHVRDIQASWVVVSGEMGIQNMVTAVYLGPRAIDTLIEAMVVVLTVFGMKYIGVKA